MRTHIATPRRCRGRLVLRSLLGLTVLLATVASCAHIQVRDQHGKETGIPFYPAKTYVVVETTKDGSKLALLSVPDVTRPHTIRHEPGWGTAQLNVSLSNGMLTSVNQSTDAKGSETIAAVGSLVSGVGALASGLGAAPGANIVRSDVQDLADSLDTQVVTVLQGSSVLALTTIGSNLLIPQGDIENAATLDASKPLAEALAASNKAIRDALRPIKNEAATLSAIAAKPNAVHEAVVASIALTRIVERLEAITASPSTLVLYEVVEEPEGRVGFRRVELSPGP